MHRRIIQLVLALLVCLPTLLHGAQAPTPEDLWEAAREGDVQRVEALLEQGIDPDAANRYGVTAMALAAQEGHTEVVKRLIGAGASIDAADTFYGMTPAVKAFQGEHYDLAAMLVEMGAGDPVEALGQGIRVGSSAIVKAALGRGPLYPYQKNAVLGLARESENEEIVRLVEAAEVETELPKITLESEQLDRIAGSYAGESGPLEVTRRDNDLYTVIPGMGQESEETPSVRLLPVSDTEFRVADDPDVGLIFRGRAGTIEGAILEQGNERSFFRRADADDETASAGPSGGPESQRTSGPVSTTDRSPHWPSFRGLHASGLGSGTPPVTWDLETGENVLWVTEIPGAGHASPVIWGDRIFLATAVPSSGETSIRTGLTGDVAPVDEVVEQTWKLLALDKTTGKILWERTAGKAVPETKRHFKSTQANSTPATDGRHVVAVFPTTGMFCWTVDGELLWKKDLGALDAGWFYDPTFEWGFGSSPILHDGKVILQADVQETPYLAAWDVETGEMLWKTERPGEVPGWSTPLVVEGPQGDELVTNGSTIRAYDPDTGKELWSLGPNSELPIATPFTAHDLVYVSAGYPPVRPIYAVKPGSRGDLSLPDGEDSSARVPWSKNRGGAYMPTPLVVGDIFYMGHHDGRLETYDARTGERIYRARFSEGGAFTASPVSAGDRIYFSTEDGEIYVVRAGTEYEELAVHHMGEIIMATPAVSEGVLYVRTLGRLIALGETPTEDDAR